MSLFLTSRYGTIFFIAEIFYLFARNIFKYGVWPVKNEVHIHNHFHFGDCAIDILFLTKQAQSYPSYDFFFYAKSGNIKDLARYSEGLPNLNINELSSRPYYSINSWKNFRGRWSSDGDRFDFVKFYLRFYSELSCKFRLQSPMNVPTDLLFDGDRFEDLVGSESYDFLIVNSTPLSGQFTDPGKTLDTVIATLAKEFRVITTSKVAGVDCTRDTNMSLYQIGCLSKKCINLIMVATGPCWFALNTFTFNNCNSIYILLNDERIDIPDNIKTISVKDLLANINYDVA